MNYDAITAGVVPGGLRNKTNIRILLCYVLSETMLSINKNELLSALSENGSINWFELSEAIDDLIEKGEFKEKDKNIEITEKGKQIAETLYTDVPISTREEAVEAVLKINAKKIARENYGTEIKNNTDGTSTVFLFAGSNENRTDEIKLIMPDFLTAEKIKNNFEENPSEVFAAIRNTLFR